jgi:predicted AAA+ superfamily ATPase
MRKEFEDAIAFAARSRQKDAEALPFLSIGIAGPSRSGKTHIAREYIDALADKKLIDPKKVLQISYSDYDRFSRTPREDIDKDTEKAKGGVLIVDDIEPRKGVASVGRDLLDRKIEDAICRSECVVILVGTVEGLDKFKHNPALTRRMCEFTVLTREGDFALPHPVKPLKALKLNKEPPAKRQTAIKLIKPPTTTA